MKNIFQKIPLFLSIVFFILSLMVFFFLYQKINDDNKNAEQTEITLQTRMAHDQEVKLLDNSIKMIEKERAELETHFAQSSDVVPFLDTIENLALQVSATPEVTSVNILPENSGLMVGIKVSGTFTSIYKF